MLYTVELNYNASIQVTVEANDEGDALGKARDIAEDADMAEFSLANEREARIISTH